MIKQIEKAGQVTPDGYYDDKGRYWVLTRYQKDQALRDSKLCRCGTCFCCRLKKAVREVPA